MKEKELRKRAVCKVCEKKVGHAGMPFLWTVKIERHILDLAAIQRQTGLGLMVGGFLAKVMGPDEELTRKFEAVDITICETCAMEKGLSLFDLMFMCREEVSEEESKEEDPS